MPILIRFAILFACIVGLAGCDSAEERAEKHFKAGLELLDAGDATRAILEFRNALSLDKDHREARLRYARVARANGNIPEAYANYLNIAEASPEDTEARLALSEMAILAQNWEEAERHAKALFEADADVERQEIVALALNFREAVLSDDKSKVRELVREAEELAKTYPNDDIIARVLIEGYLDDGRVDEAIAVTSAILEEGTDRTIFYQVMAELLVAKGDMEALESHFRLMLTKFPDDEQTKLQFVRLLISEGRGDRAEDFLREEIAKAEDKPAAHVSLIALIRQLRGDEAAIAEIDAALPLYENAPLLTTLKAGLLFDRGDRDKAINLMQSITEGKEPSTEINDFNVTLAKMLLADGNVVGARQLVEATLEHDAGHVEALKMQAVWQIEADETDAAIQSLRRALDGAPDDAEAMTIMSQAHARNGDAQLARDLLALAVEASGHAPGESVRFARAQMAQERYTSAEEALISALRKSPGEPNLLLTLGQVYIETEDWSRAEQVAATLRRLDNERAELAADDLQLRIISGREGRQGGIDFLESLVQNSSDATAAKIALIQARLQDNDAEAALSLAQEIVEEQPDDPSAKLVLGNTQLALGRFEEAEATFRESREATAGNTIITMQLLRALSAQGKNDETIALLNEALADQPDNPDLLWAHASYLEKANDIEGAIDVYEKLYSISSNNQVVANNLASLLVTYRDDEASLDRAMTVGKRLRDTEFPPFQDTYGWLLYRQGQYAEALKYLKPAAEALSRDPIVQYHLAKVHLALGQEEQALAQFETVVAVAGTDDPRQQIAEARTEIDRLSSESQ